MCDSDVTLMTTGSSLSRPLSDMVESENIEERIINVITTYVNIDTIVC